DQSVALNQAAGAAKSGQAKPTSPAKRGRPTPPPAAAPAVASSEQFYHLNFHENVRIQQGDAETGWDAAGNDLDLIFSMKSSGLDGSLADSPHAPDEQIAASMKLPENSGMAVPAVRNRSTGETPLPPV